jgi:hypothetical protein
MQAGMIINVMWKHAWLERPNRPFPLMLYRAGHRVRKFPHFHWPAACSTHISCEKLSQPNKGTSMLPIPRNHHASYQSIWAFHFFVVLPHVSWVQSAPFYCMLLKCISELPSSFHQFALLVALASAWNLTWYQSPGSRVRVLVFTIYWKITVAPLCVHVLTFSSPVCVHVLIFSSPVCVHVLTFSSPVIREWGCWSV